MHEVLVLIDHDADGATEPSLELLRAARVLGEPAAVIAATPGAGSELTDGLAESGAERVYIAESSAFEQVLVTPKVDLLAHLMSAKAGTIVMVNATLEGREIAGRLAVRSGSGLLTDVVGLDEDGVATQAIFGGTATSRSRICTENSIFVIRPNAFAADTSHQGAGEEISVAFDAAEEVAPARVVERRIKSSDGRPPLAEAPVVVCGGRGAGGEGGFEVLGGLADVLGAALGASRVATDSGWFPHQLQIGQTGVTVAPQLYIAAGVSGAIQHRAGMLTSKTVVAINMDPDAPIFELADFGLVADMFDAVPRLTEAIRAHKSA